MKQKLFCLVLLTLLVGSVSAGAEMQVPAASSAMQHTVTLSLFSTPLHTVLSAMSAQTGVPLSVSHDLAHYRLSLYITKQPLLQVMQEIVDLFGHGKIPNRNYGWEKYNNGYLLVRTGEAIQEEQDALKYPLYSLKKQLREIIQFVKLPLRQRKKFVNSDCQWIRWMAKKNGGHIYAPQYYIVDVLRAMTPEQVDTLCSKMSVEVDQATPSKKGLKQLQIDARKSSFEPPLTYLRASQFHQAVVSVVSDRQVSHRDDWGKSLLDVQYMKGHVCPFQSSIDIDPLQTEFPLHRPPAVLAGRVINILPPHCPRGWLYTTLQRALRLIAQKGRIQMISEAFIGPSGVVPKTKGHTINILNRLCDAYGYRWRKENGTYLLYSLKWAQDRRADIRQSLIDTWNADYARKGYFTLNDVAQMSYLNKWQTEVLRYACRLQFSAQRELRFLAALTPGEVAIAERPGGLLYTPPTAQMQALLAPILQDVKSPVPPYHIRIKLHYRWQNSFEPHITILMHDSRGVSLAGIRQFLDKSFTDYDNLAPGHPEYRPEATVSTQPAGASFHSP